MEEGRGSEEVLAAARDLEEDSAETGSAVASEANVLEGNTEALIPDSSRRATDSVETAEDDFQVAVFATTAECPGDKTISQTRDSDFPATGRVTESVPTGRGMEMSLGWPSLS